MNLIKELEVGQRAVQAALELCCRVGKNNLKGRTISKQDRSPVTIADFGSQILITKELNKAYPDDPIIAEEDTDLLKKNNSLCQQLMKQLDLSIPGLTRAQALEILAFGSKSGQSVERFWVLDPIDGTKGFLNGRQYAVALGLIENNQVVLGILGCPHFPDEQGGLFYGVKGQGSFVKNLGSNVCRKIAVDGIENIKQACFCESVESAHAAHDFHSQVCKDLGISTPPYRIDSQVKYAAVASGVASIYLRRPKDEHYQEKIWDHAPGAIIVEEAGGCVSDFSGRPLDFTKGRKLKQNCGILVTNGFLHQTILQKLF